MNEAARLQLLDAIGITSLVPRFVLPGARPSSQCDVTGLYADAVIADAPIRQPAAMMAEPSAIAATAARSKMPDIGLDAGVGQQKAAPSQNAVAGSMAPSAKGEAWQEPATVLRLQVSLIQHHARCFSLLPVYRQDFQQEADQFLRAVLLALGTVSSPLATQVFRWPFANNAKLDQGPAALREALGGFVQHAAREPDSVLLLWGLDLARHLLGDVVVQPGEFALPAGLRVIATHRVQDYFNEPLRKRELWRQLGVLKPLLKAGAA